jgi:hypothetical protein
VLGGDDLTRLRARLREAAAWCVPQAGAFPLWTPGLVDALRAVSAASTPAVAQRLMEEPYEVVSEVVGRRAARLRGRATGQRGPGRVLVSEYDSTVWCGASEAESQGLVNVDDVPAWDLWIGLIPAFPGRRADAQPALLAWIPEPLVDRAGRAVEVNPVEALTWLDARDPELARALLAAG